MGLICFALSLDCQDTTLFLKEMILEKVLEHEYTDTTKITFSDGSPKVFLIKSKNKAYAKAIFFHPTRKVKAIGFYHNKKRVGKWEYYTESGFLILEEYYQNGKLNGPQNIYYPETNQIARIRHYINDTLNGPWIEYFPSGREKIKGNFNKGVLEGKVEIYYPDGTLRRTGYYKSGLKEGIWTEYSQDGKVRAQAQYKEGKEIEKKIYTPTSDTLYFKLDTTLILPPSIKIEEEK